MIFSVFQKKLGFWVFLVHPTVVSVLLSASVERCFVSCMRDFSHHTQVFCELWKFTSPKSLNRKKLFSSNRPPGPVRSSSRDVRCMYVCMCVPFHVVNFEAYFAPTSRSRMSKKKIVFLLILPYKTWWKPSFQ